MDWLQLFVNLVVTSILLFFFRKLLMKGRQRGLKNLKRNCVQFHLKTKLNFPNCMKYIQWS